MTSSEERKKKLSSYITKLDLKDIAEEVSPGILQKLSKVELSLDKFITQDKDLLDIKARIRKLSPSNLPILIVGESGVGKELLAQALHGDRVGKFVAVNCGGIPDTLLEAEFFGSIPGAFTGAINRQGYFEEAKNGTIFLDEIGEMPFLLQCKLLRTLQENKIRRIGSNQEIAINCRIISATNSSLSILNEPKRFRIDLYYRLAGHIIYVKPLRDRPEDIKLIGQSFGHIIEDDKWPWHGNVRELINRINEAKILQDISTKILQNRLGTPPAI